MEQDVEERFARVEKNLETASKGLVETQLLLRVVVESQQHVVELFGKTQESIAAYVDAANIRMKQMEESLDALIRIITADHSNGHKKV
jgi:hypothetical protein